MAKIVFLLEETSMKIALNHLLKNIIPEDIEFQLISHQGKSALCKSIPHKLKGWREPGVRFVIVHDQDSTDCIKLKTDLVKLTEEAGRKDTLIRIACTELESWFIGDLIAVERAYSINLDRHKNKAKYRDPDRIPHAKEELRKLTHKYQPIMGADLISKEMDFDRNRSHSFHVFISGVQKLCTDMIS
jgi:hypothetical protein